MSVSPVTQGPRPQRPAQRLIATGPSRSRRAPSARRIAFRRAMVTLTKFALPLLALLLLASVALWPEVSRVTDQSRVAFRRAFSVEADSGRMRSPRYRGVDEKG